MPNRDGTGPAGTGMGRGIGWRADGWYGCRRVAGSQTEKDWLTHEKEILESRLKDIGHQLEGISKNDK